MPAFDEVYFTGTGWTIWDGDVYVSSIGDDVGGNGNPLNPYATIGKAIAVASSGQKIVVGTGTYFEEVNASSKNILLYGDGHALISTEAPSLKAFTNLGVNSVINGFQISGFETAVEGEISVLENCVIIDSSLINFGGQIKYCVLKNNVLEAVEETSILSCTFIAVEPGGTGNNNIINIYDSIFDSDTVLDLDSSITVNFDYCNQEPGSQVKIDSVTYNSASAVHAAFPAYQTKGLNVASGFNKPSINDYSLSSGSPLKNKGRFYKYMGAKGEAKSYSRSNLTGARLDGIVINNGRYELEDGFNEGTITTRAIDLANIVSIGKINLFAEQIFETPPYNAVVDASVEDRPPNVITFLMRYGNTMGALNTASYKEYLWDQIPTIDGEGLGNGDPEFDTESQTTIDAKYLQLQIVLKRAGDSFFLVQEDGDCLLQENLGNIIWKY